MNKIFKYSLVSYYSVLCVFNLYYLVIWHGKLRKLHHFTMIPCDKKKKKVEKY